MRAYERFLTYIARPTASCEANEACPSTESQRELAKILAGELVDMGAKDVSVDENGYVFAGIPATAEGRPVVGFIAHMDTVSCVKATDIHSRLIPDYDGGEITLDNGDVVGPGQYPELSYHKGKTMIVTGGDTILGADDKAGVAEIMTAAEKLLAPDAPAHGRIMIGFTPDEEIGRGADKFDVARFGADYAYTVDGGRLGDINWETFNAARGLVKFHGISTHPGSGKGVMVNACLVALAFASLLPDSQTPAATDGYDGFYHLCEMQGAAEDATLDYIIRDHDKARFEAKKDYFRAAAALIAARYGEGSVECEVKDQYYNMAEVLKDKQEILDVAMRAYRAEGVEPFTSPVRGGTDGSRLSFMGLPCPNLSSCGMNCHGRHEMVPVEDMDRMADVLVRIAALA